MQNIIISEYKIFHFSIFIVHLIFWFSSLSAAAFGDEIRVNNGDRITGKVTKVTSKNIIINTEYAGNISVSLASIEGISSDVVFHFELKDSSVVSGKITGIPKGSNAVTIENADEGEKQIEIAKISAVRSSSEQEAYIRRTAPKSKWTDLWNGNMNLGFTLTSGNTKTRTLATGANLARETQKDKATMYANYARSTSISSLFGVTKKDVIRGGWRYQYNIPKGFYVFAFTDFEHNNNQFLDLRIAPGQGFGYYLIKNKFVELEAFGGASMSYEDFFCKSGDLINGNERCSFADKIIRNSAEGLVGESLVLKFSDKVNFNKRLQLFSNISQGGEYRGSLDSSINVKLMRWLTWNITASDRYMSNPPIGSKNNDLLLTTGFGVSFNDFFKR
jgi:putative salt-induced outer membrane protein YdiY